MLLACFAVHQDTFVSIILKCRSTSASFLGLYTARALPMSSTPTQPFDPWEALLVSHDTLLYICRTWAQNFSLTLRMSCHLVIISQIYMRGSPPSHLLASLYSHFSILYKHITLLHSLLLQVTLQHPLLFLVSILCQSSRFRQTRHWEVETLICSCLLRSRSVGCHKGPLIWATLRHLYFQTIVYIKS